VTLSAKVEYAAVAVLELAIRYGSGEPVRLREIADTHGIPSAFLVQIMLQLKAAGLVDSTRGAAGGYRLARDPAQVSLAEVKSTIEGRGGELTSSIVLPTPTSRVLLETWRELDAAQRERLASVTFGELVDRCRGETEKMYYI
jgi:Rrf2 family protein